MIQRSPNQTRGRTPCLLSSSGRVSVACANSSMRVSAHSCVPEEVGGVGAQRQLRPGQHLGGVPVARELGGGDLQVQLHAGARRLRRDRLRLQAQSFRACDVDQDVLATGGENRVVERLIAGRLAHPTARKVFGHQRRQDADHHDVRAAGVGLRFRGVEAGPHIGLQLQRCAAGQWPGWNVEFDVVGAQFGLIGRVGDRRQHFLIAHSGLILAVDEVALDLHAGQRPIELETGLGEHRFEDVQAQLHLAPVLAAVRATEVGLLHFLAHKADATAWMTAAQGNRA